MKVLLSAYSCLPGRGSEPGAGWAWAAAATRDHEVWLLTHTANAVGIEPMRSADPRLAARLHPVYVHGPLSESLRRRGPLRFVYYVGWQLGACRRAARRLHAVENFDIAHHVTYASDWMPAGVGSVPALPFVWGPVGGSSTRACVRLRARLGLRTAVSELVRAAVLTPLRLTVGRSIARRAALVLGQNADVARTFAPVPVTVEPHVAVESDGPARSIVADGAPTAVSAGRLLGWKGTRLALAALRRPEAAGWRLDVYGDGVERERLARLATRWDVADRVRFLGNRPRAEVREALARADVVLFPSVHDAAGWTVAEAVAVGCPVVALRLGGPATLIGEYDGVLVDPSGDVVAGLAAALDVARALRPAGNRWGADRLPDVITDVYRLATDRRLGAVAA